MNNNLVPPKTGSHIPYICQKCGEHFEHKKSILPLPVKCPKCGSIKCISPLRW